MKNDQVGDMDLLDVFDESTPQAEYSDEIYNMILESINVPKINSTFDAVMYGEDDTHYLLDMNFKDVIRVPKTIDERRILLDVPNGENVNVLITSISDEGNEYSINGSVSALYKNKAFSILDNIENNEFVNVEVMELTSAGYNCRIIMERCYVDAFLPQVLAGVNRIHDDAKADLVGNNYNMCIESFARDKGTWIVSRRKYLTQLIPSAIEDLVKGESYTGYVTGTAPFGVFVQFNECLTGLIHSSNLSDEMLTKFENRDIKAGDEIVFFVKEVIKKDKIILSQIVSESLWDKIEIGDEIDATIKEHKPFGTLVVLDSDTLGLIHSSEQTDRVKGAKPDDKIRVKVIALDRDNRNIFLTTV